MKVFTLEGPEVDALQDAIDEAIRNRTLLRLAFDPTDEALKTKTGGRWSAPLGTLEIDD